MALFGAFILISMVSGGVHGEGDQAAKKRAIFEIGEKKAQEIRYEAEIKNRISSRSKLEKEKTASAASAPDIRTIEEVWTNLEKSVDRPKNLTLKDIPDTK